MADLPPTPNDTPPPVPRWVLACGIIAAVLIVAFVLVHLAGGGFRNHLHG